jgi:DUF1680 family protein
LREISQNSCEITVIAKIPAEFTLRLRKPDWPENFKIEIGGEKFDLKAENGWVDVKRIWNEKTVIKIMQECRVIPVKLAESDNRCAFRIGPVLTAKLSDGESVPLYEITDEEYQIYFSVE